MRKPGLGPDLALLMWMGKEARPARRYRDGSRKWRMAKTTQMQTSRAPRAIQSILMEGFMRVTDGSASAMAALQSSRPPGRRGGRKIIGTAGAASDSALGCPAYTLVCACEAEG